MDETKIEEVIKEQIKKDYEDLIELRNRIKEPDTIIYEEDSFTLDRCLDYLELFMKHLGIGE
jgi:ribosome assembly protein YihI (activator of Der GTPase)